MKKVLFFTFFLFFHTLVFSNNYKIETNIVNLAYGFQLGDLIVIEDKIISDQKFSKVPKLIIEKHINLQLTKQTYEIIEDAGEYIFINKIIYQIFQKTNNGHFELPLHKYTFSNENILMPQKKYWFTKIANSPLNNALQDSIDQKKPSLLENKYQFSYLLAFIILLITIILIYKNIDIPFLRRMNGPFAKAHRKIKILNKKNEKDNYVDSILILTNGFNKTFGKNINISNLNEFTEKNINYRLIKEEIKIFVEVSSAEIYSSKTYFTKNRFNDIYNFSKLLRTIERKL
jgi:hypothetical protein